MLMMSLILCLLYIIIDVIDNKRTTLYLLGYRPKKTSNIPTILGILFLIGIAYGLIKSDMGYLITGAVLISLYFIPAWVGQSLGFNSARRQSAEWALLASSSTEREFHLAKSMQSNEELKSAIIQEINLGRKINNRGSNF